jgi:hypothetical protein
LTGLLTLPFVTLAQSENNTSMVNFQLQTVNVEEEKAIEITAVDQDVNDAESLIEDKILTATDATLNAIEETQKQEYKSQTFEGPEGDIYDW